MFSDDFAAAPTGDGSRRSSLQLGDVASRRFLFVRRDLPPRKASEVIEAFAPERVILQSGTPGKPTYHLLVAELVRHLLEKSEEPTAGQAAAGLPPVPALEASSEADEAPDRCIVLEGDQPVGFFDVEVDVPDVQRGHSPYDPDPETVPRLLMAEMERTVTVGRTISLLVSLAHPDLTEDLGLPLALPLGSVVDLYVRTRGGLEVEGPREGSLVVTEEVETLPVQFRLRAEDSPGEGRVELLTFFRGSCLGRLVLPVTVTSEPLLPNRPVRYGRELYPDGAPEPDLTLIIQEHGDPTRPELLVRLWSADSAVQGKIYGPIRLRADPRAHFDAFFRDVEGLGDDDPKTRPRAIARLERKGAELFQALLPEDLRVLLWSQRRRIKTLRVESEEPWIPWELCRLVGYEGGRIVEGGFFCEEFEMGRWILGVRRRHDLRIRRVGLITPVAEGVLGAREKEGGIRGFLEREGVCVEPISCRYLPILRALASAAFDAFHFAGHGAYRSGDPNSRSQILLDEREVLTPEDLSGEVSNLGRTRPLVFLNACQTGRVGHTLTDLGGWAPKVLQTGAGAFLGTLWSVSDRGAEIFARTFYEELLAARKPIGQAVRQARLAVRRELPGDPAWLAYSLYANPLTRSVNEAPETTNAAQ